MQKRILLIMLIALLLAVNSWSATAFGKIEVGTFAAKYQHPAMSVAVGSNIVILADTSSNTRFSQYTGAIRSDGNDFTGASTFTMVERYIPMGKLQPFVAFGTGFLFEPKDTEEDILNLDIKAEIGLRVISIFAVSAGINYVPRDGHDLWNPYFSLNLNEVIR